MSVRRRNIIEKDEKRKETTPPGREKYTVVLEGPYYTHEHHLLLLGYDPLPYG